MTHTASESPVLEKLRKLIRMQEGAIKIGSEGEANNAAALIAKLLTKYNLAMADIDMTEKKVQTIEENVLSTFTYKTIGGDWEFRLMYVICKYNFCQCFKYGSNSSHKMVIFGKAENVETVKWINNLLADRFVALGKVHFKEYQLTANYAVNPIGLDTYLRRYLLGCANGLENKFWTEKETEKKRDEVYGNRITALVVQNAQAIEAYRTEKYGRPTKDRAPVATKIDSIFHKGVKTGMTAQINKQVDQARPSKNSGLLK